MKVNITATEVAYYFICARKLWLFARNLQCEQESDAVRMGKHIHKTSYKRKNKEIGIDGIIVVDWIDHDQKIIHEVKKSNKMENSHTWQLKYYLWYIEQKGVLVANEKTSKLYLNEPEKRGFIGELNYPKLNKRKEVVLNENDRNKIEKEILPNIQKVISRQKPPRLVEWEICKSCSYNELCYS